MPSLLCVSSRSIRCNDASRTWTNLSHFLLFTIYYRTCCDSLPASRTLTANSHVQTYSIQRQAIVCTERGFNFDEIGLNTWRSLVFFNLPLLLLHSLLRCFSSPCVRAYLHCFRFEKEVARGRQRVKEIQTQENIARYSIFSFLSSFFFAVFTIYCYILHVCIVCIYLYTMFTSNHVFCTLLLFYLFFQQVIFQIKMYVGFRFRLTHIKEAAMKFTDTILSWKVVQ